MKSQNKYAFDSTKWVETVLSPQAKIQSAVEILNSIQSRIVLIADKKKKLKGTISDGDIRRGLLRGLTLNDSVIKVMTKSPLAVSPKINFGTVQEIMKINKVFQIPIVDKKNILKGLHFWDLTSKINKIENAFVIMAGGKGTRMMPYTARCPKPMLEIDGRPMLEHILIRARNEGFQKFFICLHYLGYKIENYFQNGEKWNVEIKYLREQSPLGTAGALSLLPSNLNQPIIVTNGDVLTEVKFSELLAFHEKHQGLATMAVQLQKKENPFGVVEINGIEVEKIEEKPVSFNHINAGIYVLSPKALNQLQFKKPIQMTSFLSTLKKRKKKILAYPLHEPWLDVGRPQDLLIAKSYRKKITKLKQ